MARFLLRVLINAVALWVAGRLVGATIPAESLSAPASQFVQLGVVALIFGLLNALVRPVLDIVTCPAYVLTLGLFTFVMNMIILWLLQGISGFALGQGVVDWGGSWNLFIAGIIVSIVSFLLNMVLGGNRR